MRSTIFALLLVALTLSIGGTAAQAEKVRCSAIRDSAMCVAEPTCWYDAAHNNGCVDGPRPAEDRCGVHGSETICNTSSFGCAWNAAESKCVSKE
jgi:hypothetical protein